MNENSWRIQKKAPSWIPATDRSSNYKDSWHILFNVLNISNLWLNKWNKTRLICSKVGPNPFCDKGRIISFPCSVERVCLSRQNIWDHFCISNTILTNQCTNWSYGHQIIKFKHKKTFFFSPWPKFYPIPIFPFSSSDKNNESIRWNTIYHNLLSKIPGRLASLLLKNIMGSIKQVQMWDLSLHPDMCLCVSSFKHVILYTIHRRPISWLFKWQK